MKVRFIHSIASADWSYAPKQVAEIESELAQKLINSGICVAVEEPKPVKATKSK